jgi:two-component system chemotaxis response regulator CheY
MDIQTWLSLKDMMILVVDDEADVEPLFLQHFRKEIRSNELHFRFARSGEEALNYLHDRPSEVVLILSDINMPGMTGFELLDHIRHEYVSPAPIVMMITAYGDSSAYNQAMAGGANDFLTKPLNFVMLKQKLKTLNANG